MYVLKYAYVTKYKTSDTAFESYEQQVIMFTLTDKAIHLWCALVVFKRYKRYS